MNARPAELSDQELLERHAKGDPAAFEIVFERYRVGLTRYASRMLRDEEEARDVCIEAFVRLLEGRLKVGSPSIRSLLFTTVHRLCIDRIRRRTRWTRVRRVFGAVARAVPTPAEVVGEGEERSQLVAAIDALPAKHRAAIGLIYDEGMSTSDAAEILGIQPSQLRSRLAYARRLIREHLGEEVTGWTR